MAINYIPGPEQLLVPAAREIVQGVNDFINPNFAFQKAMQKTLAADPELMIKLVDVEKATPGTLKRLGFGRIGDALSAMQESPEGEVARTERDTIVKGKKLNLENLVLQNENVNKVLTKAAEMIAQNTDLTTDAAMQMLTKQTSAERRTSEAQATTAEQTARVAGKKADFDIQTIDLTAKTLKEAVVHLPELGTIDFREEARKFLDGQLSGRMSSTYFTHPQARESFIESIEAITRERALAAQEDLARVRSGASGREVTENFRMQKAFQEYQRSGGVGTLDQWKSFLFDPATQQRAKALLANPKSAKPEDRELIAIAKVTEQQVNIDKLNQITTVAQNIDKQWNTLQESTKENRESSIASMNMLLSQRSELGGPKLNVRLNPRGALLPARWEFVDEAGNVYTGDQAMAIINDPLGGVPQLTPDIEQIVGRIAGFDGGVPAAFEAYKAQEKDKSRLKKVEDYLRAKGQIK
jgi:hypothetical protein